MRAKDIMTRDVVTVKRSMPIRQVVRLMLERRISGLPVVNSDGSLAGILTEADLMIKETDPKPSLPVLSWFGNLLWLERMVSGHRKLEGLTAGDVMTHNVVTAEEDTPVHDLANRMMQFQVKRLPIIQHKHVVGIVTRADVLKVFLREDEALVREARRVIEEFAVPGEELGATAFRGVIIVGGRIGAGRLNALVQRLWKIDGVIGIDDRDVTHIVPQAPLFTE